MQFDKNRIVIREREYLEVLDLALRVIRIHAWPLAVAFACGVVPAMCLNAWLLADYADVAFRETVYLKFMFLMLLLVVAEAPLATALMTLYLGRTLFADRPGSAEIAREFVRALPQMVWYQVICRAVLTPWVITWFVLFAMMPYVSEVVLLERNPMFGGRGRKMTTGRRLKRLHKNYGSDLFSRWLCSIAIGALLLVSFWTSIVMTVTLLSGQEAWEPTTVTISFSLAMWLAFGYFSVVRFLSYLDLRIRREGWEVELMMRAERTKLMGQLT